MPGSLIKVLPVLANKAFKGVADVPYLQACRRDVRSASMHESGQPLNGVYLLCR
jgi:hypothetical protein